MAFFGLFKKRKEYEAWADHEGRLRKGPCKLWESFPQLCDQKPEAYFTHKAKALKNSQKIASGLLATCSIKRPKLLTAIQDNHEVLLASPLVHDLLASLNNQKLAKFYRNSFAVSAMLQTLAFTAKTKGAEMLHQHLMVVLLGIFTRYFGISYLNKEERQIFLDDRKFNNNTAEAARQSEDFFKQYRVTADKMADYSWNRICLFIKDFKKCDMEELVHLQAVVAHSSRILGQTAREFSDKEKARMHDLAAYLALVYSFTSACLAGGKPPLVILAEEQSIHHTHMRDHKVGRAKLHSPDALNDLMQICRCLRIDNYRGSGELAVFSKVENILLRQVKMDEVFEEDDELLPIELPHPIDEGKCQPNRTWQAFRPKQTDFVRTLKRVKERRYIRKQS